MPDLTVERLRLLRERAVGLRSYIDVDLRPFLQDIDGETFRRKPESRSIEKDVNVTTTCSCVMALALTNAFRKFYDPKDADESRARTIAQSIFNRLLQAPWMSSGLTENNPFTTVLVLRASGFLIEDGLLPIDRGNEKRKEWDLNLGIKDLRKLLVMLKSHKEPASQFFWRSLSDEARAKIDNFSGGLAKDIGRLISLELQRLLQSGWIYVPGRFPKASAATKKRLNGSKTQYDLASANRALLVESFPGMFRPTQLRSLAEIAVALSADESHFRINEYPASAAIVYWFIDGVSRAKIKLPKRSWSLLCEWATTEFNRERSLVSAGHDAMMDPVAMAMSACLCSRLRVISNAAKTQAARLGATKDHLSMLPSRPELEHSIHELFKTQTNGIWHKYFPLFHYQDAGSNFCFTFELLEAVLVEFGRRENELLDSVDFVEGLENAVKWCEDNRLQWPAPQRTYSGWNSGGYLETLKKGQPESWATAVVHMFLWELEHALSARIQKRILKEYRARYIDPEKSNVKSLLDVDIFEKGEYKRLNKILENEFLKRYAKENEDTLSKRSIKAPRSALLFGPPGTSKTSVTEAIAAGLRWPLIQIDPSHFLRNGLDGIYLEADQIFKNLQDLAGVIVLFDEMDALVQTRDSALKLDTAAQFLTTYMLPKLTALHDHGRLIFFMATNFQERFDAAIKRTGRFDLLLCMGPPTLSAKLRSLHRFIGEKQPTSQTQKAAKLISRYVRSDHLTRTQLELYVFGEFASFIKSITKGSKSIGDIIENMLPTEFAEEVKRDSKYVGLRVRDLLPLQSLKLPNFDKWKKLSDLDALAFDRRLLDENKTEVTPLIRYLLDRRESKQQA